MDAVEVYMNLVKTNYTAYTYYVHQGRWIPTRMGKYITERIEEFLDDNTGHPYDILIISCPPQHGKLCADDTPVLTSEGWKNHGDLKVGDYVYNHKGEKVMVTYVHPKYYADTEITFTNGEKIKCHGNHEWLVYDRTAHREHVVETKNMIGRIDIGGKEKKRGHRYNFQLPLRAPIEGEEKTLAVEPYVLGVWLGDGTNTAGHICACKEDIITLDECRKFYPKGKEWVHKDTGVITRSFIELYKGLQEYGMCYRAHRTEKHIPEEYLTASHRQRLELLAGLIDTDGYVDCKHHRIVFTTADGRLKDSFAELVATFGWRTTVCEFAPCTSTSGIVGKKPYWQVAFNPTEFIPCRIKRKNLHEFSKQRRVAVCDIREIEPVSGNCITVEGGIYLIGKSMIPTHNSLSVTETLPSYYLGRYPNNRVIEISYSEDFARLFGRRNKQKIADFGQELFGISLASSPNSATEFELSNNVGGMISRGVLSGVTGRPCNLMIIDDPVKNSKEADSKAYRDSVFNEWTMSFKTRLAAGAKVIVIQTRWHEDDLAGRLIETEPNVQVINLPCEAEENDPLGRDVGEALAPEIGKGDDWLVQFKSGFVSKEGSRAWNALYQGRPTAQQGNLIQREWWKFYDVLPELQLWVLSVDASFKEKEDSDYVSITLWGKTGQDIYLVDEIHSILGFVDTIAAIENMRAKYPKINMVLIEDKANGSAIIQVLRKTMIGVIPIEPIGGKVARANAITPAIESGHVYLPKFAPFTGEFIEECAAFPNGKHDDRVDSMSQALNRLIFFKAEGKPKEPEDSWITKALKKKNKRKPLGRGEKIHVI